MSISDAEAIARADCPRCGQVRDRPCVYVAPVSPYHGDVSHWESNRAQVERVGKPTYRVHNERRQVVFELRRQESHTFSPGIAGRNERRILQMLADGEWHDEDEIDRVGVNLAAAQRCYEAGWIELGGHFGQWRLSAAGRARVQ